MGLFSSLSRRERGPVLRAEDLRKGNATLQGKIHAPTALSSPLNRRTCAAFYYRATYTAPSRLKGFIRQKLRDAECYAEDLELILEGGERVRLIPSRHDDFDRKGHQALKAQGIEGFKAREIVIAQDARVNAVGKLSKSGQTWTLKVQSLDAVKA